MRHLFIWVPAMLSASLLPAQQYPAIEGDYIEDRSNHVHGCSCEWSGESVTGGKEATLGWSFRAGSWEGTPLAGVRIAAVIQGESTLSQGQAPRKAVLLLDKSASPGQRQAAENLVRHYYGDLIGQVIARYPMEIELRRSAQQAVLRVPGLVNVEMRKAILPEDALSGALRWYEPFIPLAEYELGTTLNNRFTGQDFNYRWNKNEPGTRGYYGVFRLQPTPPS